MTAREDRVALKAFRSSRTVLSSIVALLVTACGVVVAAQVVSVLLGSPWLSMDGLYGWASTTPWRSPIVLTVAIVALLVGLALLYSAFGRGGSGLIPVHSGDPDLVVGVRARSFADALAHSAAQVPGVYEAHAAIHGATVAVTGRASPDTEEQVVRDAVLTRLAALEPVKPYAVTVELRGRA